MTAAGPAPHTDTADGSRLLVTLDGEVLDRDRPLLLADDLGVMRGDGIFEAFLVVDGRPDRMDAHLARLERSASMTGITLPDPAGWRRAVDAATGAWSGGPEMSVRIIVTRGPAGGGDPTAYLLADPLDPALVAQRRDGISVLTLERGLDPVLTDTAPWLLMGAKTLSYAVNMAAARWVREHGADEALFVAPDGSVLEGPTSAVVVARGRQLRTPPPSLGILASISLAGLYETAAADGWDVGYERLSVDDLHRADAVWLLSSIRLAARVHTLDGKTLADAGSHDDVPAMVGPPGAAR